MTWGVCRSCARAATIAFVGAALALRPLRCKQRSYKPCTSGAHAATIALQAALLQLHDADELTVLGAFLLELDLTVFFRKQGMVATDTNILTGVKTRAALTHNDITGNDNLTAVDFDAQAFAF